MGSVTRIMYRIDNVSSEEVGCSYMVPRDPFASFALLFLEKFSNTGHGRTDACTAAVV